MGIQDNASNREDLSLMASEEQCREKVREMKPRSLLALQQIESICLAPCKVTGYPNAEALVVVDIFNGSAAEVEGDLCE